MDEVNSEHLDPTSEISTETVKKRSVSGVVILTGRTFLLQVISLIAQLILFAYLGKYEFGIFAIVSAIINFLVYFSDIGLAAALIQKKEEPTERDYRTTFTVQQILVLVIISIIFLLTPFFVNKYSLSYDGKILLYALSFSLLLSSLKSIPSVILERKLEFMKLVFPQVLEQVVYNVLLVVLAMNAMGLKSFTYAVIARGIVGLLGIYIVQPWKPALALSISSLKELFKFGIPYQLNTFLATLKDDGLTIVLGGILGPAGVGVLAFAQKITRLPLTFFMDTVTKVTFPAFSRLQDHKSELQRSVTRSIFFICFLVFPSLAGIATLAPIFIEIIPRYSQWTPALIPIVFIAINFGFAAATTQLTNLLNAIGKIRITFLFMIMWTVLTWAFVPFLSKYAGATGASIGYALVGVSSIFAIFAAKKYVNFSIADSMLKPLMGTVIMTVVLVFTKNFVPISLFGLEVLILVGLVSYGTTMITIVGMSLVEDAKKSFKTFFAKN